MFYIIKAPLGASLWLSGGHWSIFRSPTPKRWATEKVFRGNMSGRLRRDDRQQTPCMFVTIRERKTVCVNEELTGTHGMAIEYAHPRPPCSLTSQTGFEKSSYFNFHPTVWRSTKIYLGHILEHSLPWSYAINNRTVFSKAPNERKQIVRSSSERHDHHCGVDIVSRVWCHHLSVFFTTSSQHFVDIKYTLFHPIFRLYDVGMMS